MRVRWTTWTSVIGAIAALFLAARRLRDVLGYMGDLLSTLSVYHRGGLWHKDVKPENVIVLPSPSEGEGLGAYALT